MSDLELDERTHRDALVALITAVTDQLPVYDYGTVPGDIDNPVEAQRTATPPDIYAVVAIERRYSGEPRQMASRTSRSGWRTSFRTVGTTPDEARWARQQITIALDAVRITVAGETSTRILFESNTEIGPDQGKYSGLIVWTYAL